MSEKFQLEARIRACEDQKRQLAPRTLDQTMYCAVYLVRVRARARG